MFEKNKQSLKKGEHLDPVCGMHVTENTAMATANHDGEKFYFCSPECRDQFQHEPAKFAPSMK